MSSPRVTLLIPHLLWPEPNDAYAFDDLTVPGLTTLLVRGQFNRAAIEPWEASLLALMGVGEHSAAELRRRGEADSPDARAANWLCADPVHLKFHHERIVLADTGAFSLAAEESAALIEALNREFGDLGRFEAPHPERWYLSIAETLAYRAPPLSAAAGRTLDLPEGGDAARVKRWLNEIQMMLHAHPVNQAREARGQPPVNGLWLWGGGEKMEKIGDRPRFPP